MSKYRIEAREVVYYLVEVEANNENEVQDMISKGAIDWGEPVDGEDFTILWFDKVEG